MGRTVLYIAFGIVALWLLGEVLLQYKARLRWRLLAFAGFLGVVLGVLIPSVVVIGLGAAAFAVGQTYVTLSFRQGFAAGWAVKRPDDDADTDGSSKRRRGKADHQDPVLTASDPEAAEDDYDGQGDRDGAYGRDNVPAYGDDGYDRDDVFTPAGAAETAAVYSPQPLPDETGTYGIYGDPAYATAGQSQDQNYATAAQGTDQAYAYDYSGYGQQQYGYDTTGQQQYANYSDPYAGTQTYGGGASYDTGYGGQQSYGQDQYATGGYGETPAGGVWVPQQRTDETYGGELPQEQQYPYQGNGQQQPQQPGNGYDEQYRF
ncbi:hypothetical protein ACIPSA_01500 [Streptomyces sp. NPDC086549]|uniref:SCO2102 family sporulation regulator n=1 Tax=Streptomyces sp. NPDC086549 TaxID=3365752 RepID=UPI003820026A